MYEHLTEINKILNNLQNLDAEIWIKIKLYYCWTLNLIRMNILVPLYNMENLN